MQAVEAAITSMVLLPIGAAGLVAVIGGLGRRVVEAFSTSIAALVLLCSIYVWASGFEGRVPVGLSIPWLSGGPVILSFYVDYLSRLFSLIVGLIGFLVVLYSIAYMERDPGYVRYYAFLLLFIGSMEGLVLADNLGAVYVFWEVVGLCSFALIAHYYFSPRASLAGVKAFITTRLADIAFFVGVAYAYLELGSLDYAHLARAPSSVYETLALLVFVGAIGKSAQVPLHVWLPDAMEGPTPVSALIHAATMVKAGVYIVARLATLSPVHGTLPYLVAVLGIITAAYAALCGAAQYDAKRLLAYSTISQLGYLFAVLGAALAGSVGVNVALGHVVSHAVFKALLFLVVGVVIHELEPLLGPEIARDLRRVAGSLRKAPIVAAGLVAGALSLAGIPPFAGAWSKEVLIAQLYHYNSLLTVTLLAASIATAFYAFKLVYALLAAKPASEAVLIKHVPWTMQAPIAVLAALTLLSPWLIEEPHPHLEPPWTSVGSALAVLGALLAWAAYRKTITIPQRLYRAALEGFYFDEVYRRVIVPSLRGLFTLLARGIIAVLDAGVYAGVAAAAKSSLELSSVQRARISNYIASFILGLLVVIVVALAVG